MDDVIIALQHIGLGGKLINAALVEMGFALVPFPSVPNAEVRDAASDPRPPDTSRE